MKRVNRPRSESGFALLMIFVLAAGIAIALLMQLPRVCFETQRDREQMLIDRGEQYERAIGLYTRKFNRYPAKLEDLDNTNNIRFLRKHYLDPMTGKDDWRLIHAGPGGMLTDSLVQKAPGLGPDGKPIQQSGMPGSSGMNSSGSGGSSFGMNAANMSAPSGMNANPGNSTNADGTPAGPPEVNQAVRARPSDRMITRGSGMPGVPFDPNQPPPPPGMYPQYAQAGQPGYQQNQFPQPGQPGYQQNQFPQPGQPGYQQNQFQQPGQPGYQPNQFPQPGQPGYQQNQFQRPGQPGYGQPGFVSPAGQPTQQWNAQTGSPAPGQAPQLGQVGYQPSPTFSPAQPYPSQVYPGQTGSMQPVQPAYQQAPQFGGRVGQQPGTILPGNPGSAQQPGYVQQQPNGFPPAAPMNTNGSNFQPPGQSGGQNTAAQMIQQILTQPRQQSGGSFGLSGGTGQQVMGAGIAGVATKYKSPSIKIYNERQKYQEWEFVYDPRKEAAKRLGNFGGAPQPGMNPGNRPSDSSTQTNSQSPPSSFNRNQ